MAVPRTIYCGNNGIRTHKFKLGNPYMRIFCKVSGIGAVTFALN